MRRSESKKEIPTLEGRKRFIRARRYSEIHEIKKITIDMVPDQNGIWHPIEKTKNGIIVIR